ncbi:MAG: ABC transporter permease subunit [Longimicrobiales bacterium]|nr:ABC transporter permease subunit [Longimicrobiales bacterium]
MALTRSAGRRPATWRRGRRVRGVAAAALVALPVGVGVVYMTLGALGMVGPGSAGNGASPARIARVLGERAVWEGTLWSLWVAAASTALATLGAAAVAVAYRGTRPLDRAGRTLSLLPLAVPHLAAAVGALLVLGQSGLLARVALRLGWIAGPAQMPALVLDPWGWGLILALTWKELPFLALVASSVLATHGTALEETARGLGAGPWAVLLRVTWPTLWRGMLPAAVAVFTFVAGSYEAAALLAPSDPLALPLLTWERHTDAALTRRGDAYVLGLLAVALAALAVAAHEWLAARGRRSGA